MTGNACCCIFQKLAEMAEVLQAREDKLLQLSKDNCDLVEANSILTKLVALNFSIFTIGNSEASMWPSG